MSSLLRGADQLVRQHRVALMLGMAGHWLAQAALPGRLPGLLFGLVAGREWFIEAGGRPISGPADLFSYRKDGASSQKS